jgi:hypothetical protein
MDLRTRAGISASPRPFSFHIVELGRTEVRALRGSPQQDQVHSAELGRTARTRTVPVRLAFVRSLSVRFTLSVYGLTPP